MNTRYLIAVFVLLAATALAMTSQSMLTPDRGADHVFYGPGIDGGAFLGQEIAIGDFDGDGRNDFVGAIHWDDPDCGGWNFEDWTLVQACDLTWTSFKAELDGDTVTVCRFPGTGHNNHWEAWVCVGWDSIPGSEGPCASCLTAEYRAENTGAAYVFMGGNYAAYPHDTDLTVNGSGGADHMILGGVPFGNIYNGMTAGDVDNDGRDELILGAPDAGSGAVYILQGATSWPSVIDLGDVDDFDDHVPHFIMGRNDGDELGVGIVTGHFDNDSRADLVVTARGGDGPDGDVREEGGEIYLFFGANLPDTLDLSSLSDNEIESSNNVAVIYGPAESSYLGVTHLYSCHPTHPERPDPHTGHYNPVGLAVGDWDGDGRDDLVVGGGQILGEDANGNKPGDGAVYVIFGRISTDPFNKLKPGNIIDLANDPDIAQLDAPDLRITGKPGSALGAAVAFVDADGQGLANPSSNPPARDDLIIGAPEAFNGYGEAYIIFGRSRQALVGNGFNDRTMTSASDRDVMIRGEGFATEYCSNPDSLGYGDQFGGHFSGNLDFDNDNKHDLGISGQEENYVFFVESQNDWPASVYLATVNEDHPELRVVEFGGTRPASSSTIRFLDLDNDNGDDLVFGGYDIENRSDQPHAGQMWIWKGDDIWKQGLVTSNVTWSGNVFVHGDVLVEDDATLTIAAGTDVWIWPNDPADIGVIAEHTELRIEDGTLVVQGTSQEPVHFQAWTMDGEVTDSGTEWFGIWINDGATATIDHAVIRNATRAIQSRSSFTLKNSTIEDCDYIGLSIAGDGTNVDSVYVENTTIQNLQNVDAFGVNVLGDGAVVRLKDCIIDGAEQGVAVYTEARAYFSGTTVRNCTLYGVRASEDSYVSMVNSTVEDVDQHALRVFDGALVWTGNCTFQTSYHGVDVSPGGGAHPQVTLYQAHLLNNEVGLQVSGTDNVSLTVGEASENEHGVNCINGADIVVSFSELTDNTLGVRADASSPWITNNYIGENNGGIGCYNSANPTVDANKVWNNNNGISFIDDANADMAPCGGVCSSGCEDGNSFKGNSGYHFSNLTTTTIDATCNYWGKSVPAASKFYGPVNYVPYLSSDPLPVSEGPKDPAPDKDLPAVYSLKGNSPNPFNPTTTIHYEVPTPGGHVTIRVFNVRGQLVRVLENANRAPGVHHVSWNGVDERGSEVASGVYFVQMTAPNFHSARKLVLLK